MKIVFAIVICGTLVSIGFGAGVWYGVTETGTGGTAKRIQAARIFKEFEEEFGRLSKSEKAQNNIHLYKDMSLAIVEKDGTKTIRTY